MEQIRHGEATYEEASLLALRIMRIIYGKEIHEIPRVSEAIRAQAEIWMGVMGDYAAATEVYKEAMAVCVQSLGDSPKAKAEIEFISGKLTRVLGIQTGDGC